MKKQRGYFNIDFGGAIIGMGIIGVVVGAALFAAASWGWPYVKSFIHTITA